MYTSSLTLFAAGMVSICYLLTYVPRLFRGTGEVYPMFQALLTPHRSFDRAEEAQYPGLIPDRTPLQPR